MKSKSEVKLVILLLLAIGFGAFAYRAFVLGIPLSVTPSPLSWLVEAKIHVEGSGARAKASLKVPSHEPAHRVLRENFSSDVFSAAILTQGGARAAVWTKNKASGSYSFFYEIAVRSDEARRAEGRPGKLVEPPPPELTKKQSAAIDEIRSDIRIKSDTRGNVGKLLTRALDHSKPSYIKFFGTNPSSKRVASRLVMFLNTFGIPAERVNGVSLKEVKRSAPAVYWIDVHVEGYWYPFNPKNLTWEAPKNAFPWWRGEGSALDTDGVTSSELQFSAIPYQEAAPTSKLISADHGFLPNLSSLPVEMQAVYRLIILIPVGALFIAIFRNMIGLQTFGTFMPVLIALAFRETKLIWGLVLFTLIVALGLIARAFFAHLRLLLVPRLASTLTVVVLMILGISLTTHSLGMERGFSVALFPLVILTMTIERMSILWDELGGVAAVKQGLMTLLAGVLVYIIITNSSLEYIFFAFPELLLVILAINILVGRYSGFRLVELYRFRSLATD